MFGLLFTVILFSSCGKSTQTPISIFNWSLNNIPQEQATAVAYINSIEAVSPTKHIEISLHTVNGFPVGIYTMDATGGNIIGIWDSSTPSLYSVSGTLNISYSTTEKVNGTFDVMLSDGSNMKGSFSNILFD